MGLNNKFLGFSAAIFAAALWGVSGAFAQFLFNEKHFNAEWLVTVRLLISGSIMLSLGILKGDKDVWHIWKNKKHASQLIVFSFWGCY
ncbi:hypothetical protein QNH98_14325 [Myroides sp. mNGS23_01]|nr:hypothetical protein [Myroides sp. mNGS23_01]WHT38214.1 hypothetical protein QNH98_14325 [Myroides sp. mNGS23_01]